MKHTRREFLASLVAAVAGRSALKTLRVARHSAPEMGVSVRMIRRWDEHLGYVTHMDVLYGFPAAPIDFEKWGTVAIEWDGEELAA